MLSLWFSWILKYCDRSSWTYSIFFTQTEAYKHVCHDECLFHLRKKMNLTYYVCRAYGLRNGLAPSRGYSKFLSVCVCPAVLLSPKSCCLATRREGAGHLSRLSKASKVETKSQNTTNLLKAKLHDTLFCFYTDDSSQQEALPLCWCRPPLTGSQQISDCDICHLILGESVVWCSNVARDVLFYIVRTWQMLQASHAQILRSTWSGIHNPKLTMYWILAWNRIPMKKQTNKKKPTCK